MSIATVLLLAGLAAYLCINSDRYLALLRLSGPAVLAIMLLTLLGVFINGVISVRLFEALAVKLLMPEAFLLSAASTLANLLPISGGLVARAWYLRQRHRLAFSRYFSATVALLVCFVAGNGTAGILVLFYLHISNGTAISRALVLGFAAMMATLLAFWLPLTRLPVPVAGRRLLDEALHGWELIRSNRALVAQLVMLQTSLMLVSAARYWLAFRMLSQEVGAGQSILFSAASVLTQLVGFAPGGIGVTEAIVGAVATQLGFELSVSVAAVALDRVLSTVVILLVGGASSIILGRQLSDRPAASADPDSLS